MNVAKSDWTTELVTDVLVNSRVIMAADQLVTINDLTNLHCRVVCRDRTFFVKRQKCPNGINLFQQISTYLTAQACFVPQTSVAVRGKEAFVVTEFFEVNKFSYSPLNNGKKILDRIVQLSDFLFSSPFQIQVRNNYLGRQKLFGLDGFKVLSSRLSGVSYNNDTKKMLCESFHTNQNITKGQIHGDLHPGNVLVLNDGSIKIIDFETSIYSWGPIFADLIYFIFRYCDVVYRDDYNKFLDLWSSLNRYVNHRDLHKHSKEEIIDYLAWNFFSNFFIAEIKWGGSIREREMKKFRRFLDFVCTHKMDLMAGLQL